MIQSLIHTSENNNTYIYDDENKLSILVHPEIKKAHEKATDVNSYYLNKYQYLRKHGFFENLKIANFATLDEATVKDNITNARQIVFEVTDFCNLSCTYCAFGDLYEGFEERNFKNINPDYAINLLKYIFDLKPSDKKNKLYIGFYGGEPLININFIKQVVEIVNQLKTEKELDIEYNMTTNATLVHKHIDFLAENKVRLLISLDGNEKNHSYRIFTKNKDNSFHKVIENIDMIHKDYPEYFETLVSFNAVLHNRNSVKDVYEFVYPRYNKIPRITELSLDDTNPEKNEFIKSMYHSKRKDEAEYHQGEAGLSYITRGESVIYSELRDFLKNISINFYISHINALLYDEEHFLPTDTCLPFHKKILLTTRNKLLPCEKINYKYSLGEVNEEVIIDISEITKQYNLYYTHLKKVCQYCYSYKFCGICLFHMKYIDKLGTDEFVCDSFCDQNNFKKKLYRIFSYLEKYPNDFSEILEKVIIE